MGDDLTTPPDETPLSLRLSEEERVPALVIVWSADEPERVGEVAFFPELEVTTTVGRSPEGAAFFRQRPALLDRTPAIAASGISREQLRVTRRANGLNVERKGQPGMCVNGA